MSIWSKIIGAYIGFALGGPLGALLGIAAGHMLGKDADSGAAYKARRGAPGEERQIAFTVAVIALAAKLAKVDGHVTQDEVDMLKRVFPVPAQASAHVSAIFNAARKDSGGFEPYARQIASLLGPDNPVLEDLLGVLLMIAHADGVYHPAERAYIEKVGRILGFSEAEIRRIERTFTTRGKPADTDPYEILGVAPTAGDADIRSAYRKLMRANHPDKLMAQGLPEEFIAVANKKTAEINAAYDRIKAERSPT